MGDQQHYESKLYFWQGADMLTARPELNIVLQHIRHFASCASRRGLVCTLLCHREMPVINEQDILGACGLGPEQGLQQDQHCVWLSSRSY
jgi:hypothetical protein